MPHSWFVDGFIGPRIVSRPRAREPASAAAKSARAASGSSCALEEAEESDAIVVKFVVRAILDRGDASDGLSVAQCEKELAVGGLVEWIGLVSSASRTAMRSGGTHCGMIAPIIDLPREDR